MYLYLHTAIALCLVAIPAAKTSPPPNFVFILTDDQDLLLNGLVPMQKTLQLVGNEGVTFENAFVNAPICCPSRSSILTGKFLHNTGVVNNSISGHCSSPTFQGLHEPRTIAAILKAEKNYTTFYAGKYLNQYGSKEAGGTKHVPVGYDWWLGLKGNSKYYNYSLSINGTEKFFSDDYLTDLMNNYAQDFLNQNHARNSPFFMMLAPPAAHAPFTPAPRHADKFPDLKAMRTPSFNYTPINKHWLLQLPPLHLPEDVSVLDEIHRKRQQTLLAVDEMVEALVIKLKEIEVLDRTYIIFSSDNGFHIGQFGQPWDKRQPYETDIRIPFIISGPNTPRNKVSPYPISTVDFAPTILNLAHVKIPEDMDGISFKDRLMEISHDDDYERILLIEYFGEGNSNTVSDECPWNKSNDLSECTEANWCKCQDARNNTYVCLRHISLTVDYKHCHFEDSVEFSETYNLKEDPYELNNLQQDVTFYRKKLLETSS